MLKGHMLFPNNFVLSDGTVMPMVMTRYSIEQMCWNFAKLLLFL